MVSLWQMLSESNLDKMSSSTRQSGTSKGITNGRPLSRVAIWWSCTDRRSSSARIAMVVPSSWTARLILRAITISPITRFWACSSLIWISIATSSSVGGLPSTAFPFRVATRDCRSSIWRPRIKSTVSSSIMRSSENRIRSQQTSEGWIRSLEGLKNDEKSFLFFFGPWRTKPLYV